MYFVCRPWAIIFPVSLLTTSAVANAKFRPAFSHTAVIDNVSPALAAPMYLNEKKGWLSKSCTYPWNYSGTLIIHTSLRGHIFIMNIIIIYKMVDHL